MNEKEELSFAKKMKKKMEKQMNKRIFLGIILTAAVTGILLFLISCSFDLLFYNPKKPSKYIEDTELEDYVYSDFHFLMDIYTGLTYPGKRYYQVEHLSKSEGFGSYKMYAKIQDTYEPMNIDGRYNTVYQMKRNRFLVEPLTEEAKEKYPYLTLPYLSEETTAAHLEQCYLSRLQILRDNPIFLRVVSHEQGYYDGARRKTSQIDDRLAEIQEKGLWSIGLYGRITKEDFLTMVEKGEIPYAVIKDAKLSVLSK